jgi:pSer/pThr/pTyr-binding forkhead associated (FHA) protein
MPTALCLVAQTGPLAGQRYPISSAMELGRDCPAIPLSWDSLISRRHLQLMPAPGGIGVTDLGSTNGTFVNDQRITSYTLRQGDVLKIGATTFRVEPQ